MLRRKNEHAAPNNEHAEGRAQESSPSLELSRAGVKKNGHTGQPRGFLGAEPLSLNIHFYLILYTPR